MQKIIDAKYEIISKIGSGGTSNVFKAKRVADGKIFAIKILRDEFSDNDEQVERFLRESHALSHLSHENIVNIADVGKTGSSYYIAMDYVDGITLKEYIKAKRVLPYEEAIDAALQICAALEHAHENNIIHRDIKPQNILVSSEGILKVADFGIARVLNQNTLTMAGKDVVGSVHYISPEQARGTHIDARSDIYSLGVVLYELCTGSLPYSGTEAITVAMKHVNQLPPKPKDLNEDLPQCLNDIILKCLAKDPTLRYQTVRELEADLLGAANDPQHYSIANMTSRAGSALRLDEEEDIHPAAGRRQPAAPITKKGLQKKTVILLSSIVGGIALLVFLFVLIFGKGPEKNPTGEVSVPSVVGLNYEDAANRLISQGLRVARAAAEQYSSTVPEGCIISQSPVAGVMAMARDTVTLVVSAGPETALVPDLSKLTVENATKALNSVNLELGSVAEEAVSDASVAPGTVVRQSVAKDTRLAVGGKVDIWVAKSAVLKKKVPDLAGKTEAEARQIIADNGFIVAGIYQEMSAAPVGTVARQSPKANEEYDVNTTVSILIWISSGQTETYSGELVIDIPVVTEQQEFRIVYYDGADEITVYTRMLNPGEELPALTLADSTTNPAPRVYVAYLGTEKYGEYTMVFNTVEGTSSMPPPSPTMGAVG